MANRIGQYATLTLLNSTGNRYLYGGPVDKEQTYPYKVVSQCGSYVFLKHVERETCTVMRNADHDEYFNPFYVK